MIQKTNIIHYGDNLEIMRSMKSESVDLIYIDPPFFTQKDWGEFNDRFNNIYQYVEWMSKRLKEMYRILKLTGSIYLHCDYHGSHYLKIEMDKIFKENFKTEIIWKRKYQSRGTQLGHNHDTILYYTKNNKNYTFNIQTVMKIITNPIYKNKRPIKTAPADEYSDKNQKEMLYNGTAYITKNDKIRQITYLKKDKKGNIIDEIPIDNIWTDIPNMMHTAKFERLGYPTQKPEKLLERIIKMSSNPGDIVFDPFCGSGTSCAVAKKLNRQYIGIDKNSNAVKITKKRIPKTLDDWI